MKHLRRGENLTTARALNDYGGYTVINGETYVVADLPLDTLPTIKSIIIFGYEYGASGEMLGLTIRQTTEIVQRLAPALKQYRLFFGYGGWNDENDDVVEEAACIVSLTSDTNVFVLAERLRQEFRQKSVLVIDKTGEAHFIESDSGYAPLPDENQVLVEALKERKS